MQKGWFAFVRIVVIVVGLMSGLLSIVREFLLFSNPIRYQEAPLFWASAKVAFILAAIAYCWIENKEKRTAQKEKNEIEERCFNERPILGLGILSETGRRAWADAIDLMRTPISIYIYHLSGRIPMSVRFDPIPSLLGKFSLRLADLPFVNPPVQKTVTYEIWEDGKPPLLKAIEGIGWAGMLQPFFSNSPPELDEFRYAVTVRFLDRGKEENQVFTMVFSARTWELSID
jgi:hypothetical protein